MRSSPDHVGYAADRRDQGSHAARSERTLAIPIVPMGWGVGDAAFVGLLGLAGAPAGAVIATTLTFRLIVYAVALAASPLLLFSRQAPAPASG